MSKSTFRKQIRTACITACSMLLALSLTGLPTFGSAQNSTGNAGKSKPTRKSKTSATSTLPSRFKSKDKAVPQSIEQVKGWISKPLTGNFKSLNFEKMAQDEAGNSYVIGGNYQLGDTIIFDDKAKIIGTAKYYYGIIAKYGPKGEVLWVRTIKGEKESAMFRDIAVNSKGEVFVCGVVSKDKEYDFGNGVTIKGTRGTLNAFIAKYDTEGNVIWAKEQPHSKSGFMDFMSIQIDKGDNIFCAGKIWFSYHDKKTETFTFSPKVSVTVTASTAAIVVKYDANGTAQWASSIVGDSGDSYFNDLAIDNTGNLIAVGSVKEGPFAFGNKVSVTPVTGGDSYFRNFVVVKYDSKGQAQWAKTSTSNGKSESLAVTADSQGAIFVVTNIRDVESYLVEDETVPTIHDFGNKVSFSTTSDPFSLIVKYDTDGNAQWVKTSKLGDTEFKDVKVDEEDNLYAVGSTQTSDFDGVTVPKYKSGDGFIRPIIAKIRPDGKVEYATTTLISANNTVNFTSLHATNSGVFLLALFRGDEEFVFESGLKFAGKLKNNPAILKIEK